MHYRLLNGIDRAANFILASRSMEWTNIKRRIRDVYNVNGRYMVAFSYLD